MLSKKRRRPLVEDPELGNASAPSTGERTAKRRRPLDRLKVFSLDSKVISNITQEWLSSVWRGTSCNASLPGRVVEVESKHLKFKVPELAKFGPCWAYYLRQRRGSIEKIELKLLEGGSNGDPPRSVLAHFSAT
jgi:hypothetical protein